MIKVTRGSGRGKCRSLEGAVWCGSQAARGDTEDRRRVQLGVPSAPGKGLDDGRVGRRRGWPGDRLASARRQGPRGPKAPGTTTAMQGVRRCDPNCRRRHAHVHTHDSQSRHQSSWRCANGCSRSSPTSLPRLV